MKFQSSKEIHSIKQLSPEAGGNFLS